MAGNRNVQRSTVRLEKSIYDVLVQVALGNHLHTPRRGPDITEAIRRTKEPGRSPAIPRGCRTTTTRQHPASARQAVMSPADHCPPPRSVI
jgi:hypothetical protein